LQKQLDNEESISDIVELVQKTVEMLNPSTAISLPTSVSPTLQSRISTHISYALCSFVFDAYLTLRRELERIRESTAKWTKAEKNLPRRLLDARRIATELESVMEKIRQANELFIVRSLHRRDDTAPLILPSDGEHCDDGEESRGHSRGCQSHPKGYGGCQGEWYR
jgi:hypothetical protein